MNAIEILRRHEHLIKKKYHVKKRGVFGSYVRGEQKKRSDIDILVEFKKTPDFFEFLELEEYLGRKVDLVTRDALKPYIGRHILEEVVYL